MPTTTEVQTRCYNAMAQGLARAVVTATVAAPLVTYTAPAKPKSGEAFCAICNANHKLSPVGEAFRWHRIRAMRATPMQVTMWDFTRFAHGVK